MKYTFEPGEPCPYMVSLRPEEAKVLAGLLQKAQKILQKKVDRYRGLMDGGEATERQQTILMESAEKLELLERFIHLARNNE